MDVIIDTIVKISIHALHEESDPMRSALHSIISYFNPRSP